MFSPLMLVDPDAQTITASERRGWRIARAIAILVPAVLFVALVVYGLVKTGPGVSPGQKAPPFTLELFAGEDALPAHAASDGSLSSDELLGRPVVINFWASWCVPCREEAPLLQRTWEQYREDGVIFLGINIQDAKKDAHSFINEFGITYPQVRASGFEIQRRFRVAGVPETYFVDHEWRFVGIASGPAQGQEGGTKVLGAISEDTLVSNVELLIRRAPRQ